MQVNTWNEARKSHAITKAYYLRLYKDISLDVDELASKLDGAKIVSAHLDALIRFLDRGAIAESQKDTVDKALNRFYRVGDFSSNLTTYEEMASSGKLEYIANDTLRDLLAQYVKNVRGNDIVRERYARKILDNTQYIDRYVRNVQIDAQMGPPVYDFAAMARDKYLINLFARDLMRWNNTRWQFERQLNNATEIQSKLAALLEEQ